MPSHIRFRTLAFVVPLVFLSLAIVPSAAAQASMIFSFYNPMGVAPIGNLTSDAAGNLYGTTFYAGSVGQGMVYELSPSASGWKQTVLYSFSPNGIDGFGPTSRVVFDAAGNLYGTTEFGGSGSCTNGFGCGTVFELSPDGSGGWKENILHDFVGTDGWEVHPGLIIDAAGNLYGAATNGGTYKDGTIFELSPVNGAWSFSVVHQFTGGDDGGVPWEDSLTLDGAGNLYGTASLGGGKSTACRYGCGLVFELSPTQSGWTETVLHNFTTNPNDGQLPATGLIFDAAGNLYGTTGSGGGPSNAGIAFELTPNANGSWTEKVLHNFNEKRGDGTGPSSNLTFDSAGNLYGVTGGGGNHGRGTAFKLAPASDGSWSETILNNFSGQGPGGYFPNSGLLLGPDGNLYGTTSSGGRNGQGTVFAIVP